MKVSSNIISNFKPVTFTITCETESDLKVLYAMANNTNTRLLETGESINIISADMHDNTSRLYHEVDKIAKKLGFI